MPMLSAESKPQIAFDELKEDSPLGRQACSHSLAVVSLSLQTSFQVLSGL